jgi:chaperonin cofactor prefoldin
LFTKEFYSSKQHFKELGDTVTKTDEKLSYQVGTIQSSINNINTRLADLRDLVWNWLFISIQKLFCSSSSSFPQSNTPEIINANRRLDTIENSHREAEGNIQTMTNHLADLLSRHTATDTRVKQTEEKIKADEQTVRDIAARIALLPTTEDVASVRRDLNDKVCFCSMLFIRFACVYIYMYLCYVFVYVSDS